MDIIKLVNATYNYKVFNDDGTQSFAVGVDDVTLDVVQGEFLTLVGHNGSGKSTLAKLLNGLFVPQKGSVSVLGMDTANEKNLFEIRKNVGMVFQNPDNQMVASIIEEDVAFGVENVGIPHPELGERVRWALESVGMEQFAKKTPHKLSGGQKQRIAIAGALAIKPQVLVLDESTAMLDPQGRKEVLSVAKKLNEDFGMTVVLITHFMEEVLQSDRVVVMQRGKIIATGTPNEIFSERQLLENAGLKVPRTIELAQKLKESGWQVEENTADAKALGEMICQLL